MCNKFCICNRFPFDTKNPIGYCVAIVLQYALIAYNFFLLASMVSLGVGAYLFTISMAEYIKDILNAINERTQQDDENKITDIGQQLADFIEIYSILKELSEIVSVRESEGQHWFYSSTPPKVAFTFDPRTLKMSKIPLF